MRLKGKERRKRAILSASHLGGCSAISRLVRLESYRSQELALALRSCLLDILHLHALLGLDLLTTAHRRSKLPQPNSSRDGAQTLITFGVGVLEAIVCRRARATQHYKPIPPPSALRERPVPVFFEELVRVEILARRLAPSHEKQVISHQRSGIEEGKEAVYD